jgi:hypothetical protein
VRALTAVLQMVLERLVSLEVQLVKLLLARADMRYNTREEA